VNCYRIHQKSLNFIYPFKFYSNYTNKNVSWLHFSWPTQYTSNSVWHADGLFTGSHSDFSHLKTGDPMHASVVPETSPP